MDNEPKKEGEEEIILAKLRLLNEIMKLHEWTPFGLKECEDIEQTEAGASPEASKQPEGNTEEK